MSVVKINAISVPPDKQERFEERFRGRAGAVESTPGFEWFELLRPKEGTDQYLVYTRWSSEEAYESWQSGQDFDRAHDGGGDTLAPAAAQSAHLWSYEVLESAGPRANQENQV
ncbi:antibiotic biosynthesis monooxygenase [Geodermatophilus sabuli]|uniref:Antibiotic biosynthesis monooxygenase n=1 Tax=Geodermatophilus sabuli TaxID=1564158 RepID=A0A7K3VYZ6_9ACTN|nr:antibiotic biosynthesis monooxygenase [Geodermatophilus sabuli]NEK57578.1 antibiotic biosynthesis monooxygenase [Geodermatophilus sabuli]